ncbi:MAG: hypothetical protein GX591_09215 [Planctomycetes bacterium]|nr:hypothetical protein [Planctomycetota bacterium]
MERIDVRGPGRCHGSMDRKRLKIVKMKQAHDDGPVPGTPAERIAMVWPLTVQACLLSKRYDPERRLQRHITVLRRRGG